MAANIFPVNNGNGNPFNFISFLVA